MKRILTLVAAALMLASCNHDKPAVDTTTTTDYSKVQIPQFDADSAYGYVAAQLEFGYRTPGSKGQEQCAQYLAKTMERWCDEVMVQDFNTTLWNDNVVKGKNIIASLDPENQHRILIAAHWDSRLWADHDPDPANHKKPIPGANDGASGVAAIMEMARVMSQDRPGVGIDFIFFDVEDQGAPEWADCNKDDTWCKGSQYWAMNPHKPYYKAIYGVLFDMVGSANPRFTKEEVSMYFASNIMNKYWNVAASMGMGNIFVDQKSPSILDDHLYINQNTHIPTIDIVQNTPDCSFYPYWHTMGDDLDKIDRNSLKAVAEVTMKAIYGDYPRE